jgi:hypothetical protein
MSPPAFAAALVALALVSAACAARGDADVTATLRDRSISLSGNTLQPGALTLEGVNGGTMTHEFEVFRVPGDVDANALEVDATADTDGMDLLDRSRTSCPGPRLGSISTSLPGRTR